MKAIILGAGRRGIRLAKRLVEEKKDVVLIDEDIEVVNRAMTSVDCLACAAKGTDIDSLKEAGIEGADYFIALTGSDETNLISCSIAASEFKIPTTICAITNLSYSNRNSLMGISHIINPYKEAAKDLAREIERGIYSDIISFNNSSLVLYNVYIEDDSMYAGKQIKDVRALIPTQFIIAALSRRGQASVPSGDTVIQAGDTISFAAKESNVKQILSAVGKTSHKPKRIVIVGATKIADHVISNFPSDKIKDVTLIDADKQVCDDFSSRYPQLLVINDSITREGVFRQEGLEQYDLMICTTDMDELNILTASYSKHRGVKASIAIVGKNADYLRIASHLDIDSIISVQDASVDSIMRYIHGSNISTMHSLFHGTIEALEFTVTSNCKLCGKQLKDIDMRGKGIIAGVVKSCENASESETTIPTGDYLVEEGDILIMISQRKAGTFIHSLIAE